MEVLLGSWHQEPFTDSNVFVVVSGAGAASEVITVRTKGSRPTPPPQQRLLTVNMSAVNVHLAAWRDPQCPITAFTITLTLSSQRDWQSVSGRLAGTQTEYTLGKLLPATSYEISITATNPAGETTATYSFVTLTLTGKHLQEGLGSVAGGGMLGSSSGAGSSAHEVFTDPAFVVPVVISCIALISIIIAITLCLKRRSGGNLEGPPDGDDGGPSVTSATENKTNPAVREQYYTSVRKPPPSPVHDVNALDRIPEYAEDIYPYATFQIQRQEETLSTHLQTLVYQDPRRTTVETLAYWKTDSGNSGNNRDGRSGRAAAAASGGKGASGGGGIGGGSSAAGGRGRGGRELVGGRAAAGVEGRGARGRERGGGDGGGIRRRVGGGEGEGGRGGGVGGGRGGRREIGGRGGEIGGGRRGDSDDYARVKRCGLNYGGESEDYEDSVNSDTDSDHAASSRTESSAHLDDTHHTPLSDRNHHHNLLYVASDASTVTSPLQERKSLPRRSRSRSSGSGSYTGLGELNKGMMNSSNKGVVGAGVGVMTTGGMGRCHAHGHSTPAHSCDTLEMSETEVDRDNRKRANSDRCRNTSFSIAV
ncbi:uncharacterized protein [Cherax quadricarinatus]